ncbi:chromate transporter [Xenophilus sp. AP218F]|nr:chromate transporter [Chromobacterium sp. ASV5]OWY37827.1 chromate transporter [Xenophilus sp. AP218F]
METNLRKPDRRELFAGFFSIGLTGFGGVLPLAHNMLVIRRRWLSEADFAELLGLGQVLPGPNIVNVAVAVGARFHGAAGSLIAVAALLLAPMAIVLTLASLYARFHGDPLVAGALRGLAAAAAGLILAMGLRLAANLERRGWSLAVVAAGFLEIAVLRWPLPWVLLNLFPLTLALAWLGRKREAAR